LEILKVLEAAKRNRMGSGIKTDLQIGMDKLQIIYGDEALYNKFSPAFRHIEIDCCAPSSMELSSAVSAFSVYVESQATFDTSSLMKEVKNQSGLDNKIVTYNQGESHLLYNPVSGFLSIVDMDAGIGLYIVADMAAIPYFELAAPMRMILHWWCESHGKVLIHAAAVGWDNKAVLLCGPGGSGKSTTALLCALGGMAYLGDDYVVIENRSVDGLAKAGQKLEEPFIISIYNSAKFRWDMLARIPEMKDRHDNEPEEDDKGFLFLDRYEGVEVARAMPLKAILVPKVALLQKTVFSDILPSRALLSLASSTVFQMPGSGQATLRRSAEILRQLPAYGMALSSHNEEITHAMKDFILQLD